MNWVGTQIKESNLLSPSQQVPSNFSSANLQPDSFDLNSKISPSILLIIIILAIIFFISGLLHLLIRFLLRPQIREADDSENATALQGQLQQLFHLHDSGVDQSFIDTLPVFHYKGIIGLKNPFDCAVCLCEFDPEDKLRLLPKCSHAFHMECIDTWLLSHSTCPLCRANLLHEFSTNNTCSPFVLVLESGSENSIELLTERNSTNPVLRTDSHLGCQGNREIGSTRFASGHKSFEISSKQNSKPNSGEIPAESEEKVVPVKLGKFKYINGEEGGCSNSKNDNGRRCFSMGSFEYIMDEDSILQVPVTMNKNLRKPLGQVGPGHRPVKSVCGCESFRKSRLESAEIAAEETRGKRIIGKNSQKESFSASKIWLRGKREKQGSNSGEEGGGGRRAFSFRFPVNSNAFAGPERDLIDESGDCNLRCENLESLQEKTPSFARRTMNWLAGRQNKVVHSSFTSNV